LVIFPFFDSYRQDPGLKFEEGVAHVDFDELADAERTDGTDGDDERVSEVAERRPGGA
jgi:hypothetical protein